MITLAVSKLTFMSLGTIVKLTGNFLANEQTAVVICLFFSVNHTMCVPMLLFLYVFLDARAS